MDILQLLKKDHTRMRKLFTQFENPSGSRAIQERATLAGQIYQALMIHCQLEEEFLYPAFQEHAAMQARVSKALQEHELAEMLLAELKELRLDDAHYDAKVKVLSAHMRDHFTEEEQELF